MGHCRICRLLCGKHGSSTEPCRVRPQFGSESQLTVDSRPVRSNIYLPVDRDTKGHKCGYLSRGSSGLQDGTQHLLTFALELLTLIPSFTLPLSCVVILQAKGRDFPYKYRDTVSAIHEISQSLCSSWTIMAVRTVRIIQQAPWKIFESDAGHSLAAWLRDYEMVEGKIVHSWINASPGHS